METGYKSSERKWKRDINHLTNRSKRIEAQFLSQENHVLRSFLTEIKIIHSTQKSKSFILHRNKKSSPHKELVALETYTLNLFTKIKNHRHTRDKQLQKAISARCRRIEKKKCLYVAIKRPSTLNKQIGAEMM